LPAPKWVQVFDQGEADPRLKGFQTPRGIKLEVLPASATDDVASVGNCEVEGWSYSARGGQVIRRRQHDPELWKQLQAAAEAKKGPPTKASADGKWMEQSLLRGLANQDADAALSVSLGPDRWLYVSCGSGDHRAASWDGSQAAVLRSGAIFRLRPDGSHAHEFARGFVSPSAVAFDALGNAFCVDRGVPGTNFAGSRLIYVLPGGDYGWQQARIEKAGDANASVALQPDPVRASANGERAGTLPPMLRLERGSPGNLIAYHGAAFPEFFQGLLIIADGAGHAVSAYSVERDGATFRAIGQFDLVKSDDPLFQPKRILQGPDGAIHVHDEKSRVYRLSWGGTAEAPAIATLPADRLTRIATASLDELWKLVESTDYQVRQRAGPQIVANANLDDAAKTNSRERLAALLMNERLPPPVRATIIQAATPLADKAIRTALCRLLEGENAEIVRLAAQALSETPPSDPDELAEVADSVKGMYGRVTDACSERALQFALARLAIAGVADAAEWGFEATSVTHGPKMSRYVFDGHARALEMVPGAAKELMLGNLDVAINLDVGEPLERQRIKEFVTLTAEAMRTRELADFLDALCRGEEDLFVKVEAPLEARLIACYQNVLVDPPINADAVIEWLDKHPGGPIEVEIAALETLSIVGTARKEAFEKLAERLLAQPAAAVTLGQRLVAGHLDRGLLPSIREAVNRHAGSDSSGEATKLLAELAKLEKGKP